MSFGTNLKAYRKRSGLSQEQLAKKIGMHMQSVSDLERDLFTPGVETLTRIRNALNLTPDEVDSLLGEISEAMVQTMRRKLVDKYALVDQNVQDKLSIRYGALKSEQ